MQNTRVKKTAVKSISSALMIKSDPKKPMGREQQTFNILVNKVEKLRVELQKVSNTLDQKLKFYLEHILLQETDLLKCNLQKIKLLYCNLKNKNK